MNTAQQIVAIAECEQNDSGDFCEAIHHAIDCCLPDSSDDYKATVYSYIMDGDEENPEASLEGLVNAALESANG